MSIDWDLFCGTKGSRFIFLLISCVTLSSAHSVSPPTVLKTHDVYHKYLTVLLKDKESISIDLPHSI